MSDEPKLLKRHVKSVDNENDDNVVLFVTDYFDGGDHVFTIQEIQLHSGANSASINLSDVELTPQFLRELADELEEIEEKFVPINK